MSDSKVWVELALRTLACTQKDLAKRVGVSQTQITKWKSGENMSGERADWFRALLDIGDRQPALVLWAGSVENADKWDSLINLLALEAENKNLGADQCCLNREAYLQPLAPRICSALNHIGARPPRIFPSELDPFFRNASDELCVSDVLTELLHKNPYSAAIFAILKSLNRLRSCYEACVRELADLGDAPLSDVKARIEGSMIDLAACSIDVDAVFAPTVNRFRRQIISEYSEWLQTLKEAAARQNKPLAPEFIDLIKDVASRCGNSVHPDVHMNELLIGLRGIIQVLPAILEKLDIETQPDGTKLSGAFRRP